jgi:hypothetical protein
VLHSSDAGRMRGMYCAFAWHKDHQVVCHDLRDKGWFENIMCGEAMKLVGSPYQWCCCYWGMPGGLESFTGLRQCVRCAHDIGLLLMLLGAQWWSTCVRRLG